MHQKVKTLKIFLFFIVLMWGMKTSGALLQRIDYNYLLNDYFFNMYREDLDILFIGSSHAYNAFDPILVDLKLGINSFNLSSDAQSIKEIYFKVIKVLVNKTPKIIVLETDSFNANKADDTRFHKAFDALDLDWIKIEAINYNFKQIGKKSEMAFPLLKYHSRWKKTAEIKKNIDYALNRNNQRKKIYYKRKSGYITLKHKGFYGFRGKYHGDKGQFTRTKKQKKIYEESKKLLFDLAHILQSKGIELILVTTPTMSGNPYREEITQISEKLNVRYIDYNALVETLHLSKNDMRDDVHLNFLGAKKITLNFISILKNHYQNILPKRRDNPYWRKKYVYY